MASDSLSTVQRGNNGHFGNEKHPAKVYVCVTCTL